MPNTTLDYSRDHVVTAALAWESAHTALSKFIRRPKRNVGPGFVSSVAEHTKLDDALGAATEALVKAAQRHRRATGV